MNRLFIILAAPQSAGEWVLLIAAIIAAVVIVGVIGFLTWKVIRDGKLDQLKEAIVEAIKKAEETHASGEEKLKVAIAFIKEYAKGIGIELDGKLLEWVISYIKKYIFDHNELKGIEGKKGE